MIENTKNSLEDLDKDLFVGLVSNILQLQEGNNIVRLVLFHGYLKYKVHFLPPEVLPDLNDVSTISSLVLCLEEFGKHCPICEYARLLFQSVEENDQIRAKRMYAKERYRFHVLDRADVRDGVSTPKLLSCGRMIAEGVNRCRKEYGDPSDEKRGYDLNIRFSKVEGWNRYEVIPQMRLVETNGVRSYELVESPITPQEKALTFPSLAEALVEPIEEDIRKIFEPLLNEAKSRIVVERKSSLIAREFHIDEKNPGQKLYSPVTKTKPVSNTTKPVNSVSKPVSEGTVHVDPPTIFEQISAARKPRCFGMFDESDQENCGNCVYAQECKNNS